ncbi:ABC transporter permease [Ferrimonas marina]|uniref:Nitrate/nitrite transport system permease protein n=1 Tax=Ferrimonas marina TaxID=299255 RepID=A0A1M5R2V2_9GAMM|nr:ABC transporter permease [Ferrimonas marina]SHH20468.1 nitrate/nitrite transport system permease protein [Ferrimonas marina]
MIATLKRVTPSPALAGKRLTALLLPMVGCLLFLMFWHLGAAQVQTSLGQLPGPVQVGQQMSTLVQEHQEERDKETAFYERQEARNEARLAEDPDYVAKIRPYTGKPTFFDQIGTSLVTVMSGFALAAMVAIPLGIALGLNQALNQAINPLIQLFKPVSPLAWLPLVTMVVSALYTSSEPVVAKSFINSMVTVTLCCLWPMVINTAVGVAAIDKDLVNVSQVLRLSPLSHVRQIVLPASVPAIFTGMRLSLAVAWMVLIAAEMLSQNPGLGKFVWDEFQNGSSQSLSRIMVAVLVIGFIGFLLDRTMLQLQRFVSWDKSQILR